MASRFDERRMHPRMSIDLMVEYKNLSDFFVDYATDISQGGMFVATKQKISIGTPVNVKFSIPDERESFEANGTVVRTGRRPRKGVGIQFDPLTNRARDLIEKLWERKMLD